MNETKESKSKKPGRPKGRPPGRPVGTTVTYSRRRFHIAAAALNRVLKQPNATHVTVIRAAELLCFIYYGGILPGGIDKRDKRDVKTLCLEHNLVKAATAQVNAEMEAQQEAERLEQEQEQEQEQQRVFDALLDGEDE